MKVNGKELYSQKELADLTGKTPVAVKQFIYRNEIKPVISLNLYDESALEIIRNSPGSGRPMYIKLFMGNPTKEKVNLFLNSAKTVLKRYINVKNKFEICFSLSSSVKSPNKSKSPENKKYNEIAKLVMELFIKQNEDNLTNEDVFQSLRKAATIGEDEELLNLIDKIESSPDVLKKPRN
jgi:hypothetical protein